MGTTHKLKPSPSAWPESWNVHIPLRSTSYVPDSTLNPCVDQFLTCLTRRLDNEDTWDELASEVKKVVESSAEAMRKTQASLLSLNQCINALRKKYQGRAETSRSRDGQSQTHHTRNDESGLNPQRDSRPTKEGREQDGPLCHPSNEPNDRSKRLSPQHSQRNLDEETSVDAVTRSQ